MAPVTEGSSSEAFAYINGKRYVLPQGRGECTLLQFLRESKLTGTKLGCGEGGCGACTVMVSHWEDGKVVHRSVNACLCPLYAVAGMHVVTVEGIGNPRDGLHPVQEVLAKSHGSQCGFCTPGFVMSMYTLLRSAEGPITEEEVEDALGGNLCRCTGYRPILDAFKTFTKVDPSAYTEEAIAAAKGQAPGSAPAAAADSGPAKGSPKGSVCPSSGLPCECKAGGCGSVVCGTGGCPPALEAIATRTSATAEPIFPPELKRQEATYLHMPGPLVSWHRPATLQQLLELKAQHPGARLVVGNTEVGIEMKFKDMRYPVLIAPTHVKEMNEIRVTDEGVEVGAAVTLTRLMKFLKEQIASRPATATSTFAAVVNQLRWFAGNQIRNVSAIGGNIVTGSPISDLNPIWMAAGATFTALGLNTGERRVKASEFFLGYRQVDLQPHELLYKVLIPFTRPHEYVKEFKQSPRREDDIAIVNAGMRVRLRQDAGGVWVVDEAAFAFGGVAAKPLMAHELAAAVLGRPWDNDTLEAALASVHKDVVIADNAPGGKVEYRRSLAASFTFKFFLSTAYALEADAGGSGFKAQFPNEFRSAVKPYDRPHAHGVQFFAKVEPDQVVGQPYRHMAADLQVCGEAKYCDDIELTPNTLYAALVTSSKPHARLIKVDAARALASPGVQGFFSAKDVPGTNVIGVIKHDEEVFASEVVTCVGQVIGVVVAETEAQARRGAKLVEVTYEELPAIMSCEEAVEAGSFYDYHPQLIKGDVDAVFASGECDHVVEGVYKVGGQEHFYLETQAAYVIPQEHDEWLAFSSTQAPAKHQKWIANVLGVPYHKVVSKTKRLGGGFGGKESRTIFTHCAIAVPAYHLRRPVRMALDRDEDMQMTGQRHAFLCRYKAGFSREGALRALDLHFYNNAGNSWDLSHSVLDRALLHSDGCYVTPNMRAVGHLCKTHQASNTAFRGFGGPQGLMVAEFLMDEIARTVGRPAHVIRDLNMQPRQGYVTHTGMTMEDNRIRDCWDKVLEQADYQNRLAAVEEYNKVNRWRKRGLAAMPTKFGISFTTVFLNQGGALVHVYWDGTVLVSHGGVEMGQGLHTKVAQIAAQALGVSLDKVFISETSTDKVPNASPTAASASTDLYGAATLDACRQINERLAPIRAANPGKTFTEIVNLAYVARIDLSAHGFYSTPDITGFGGNRPFNYCTYGAAVSEVELDTLTGDFQVLRTDIVMDVGNPINPAIDIGQVEGAFVQGMGWACLEELIWGDKQHSWVRPGQLFTRGPGTYKIPTANDIPLDFRVSLLQNAPNKRAVHSSKAIGEPPFQLGCAVLFALKEAVYAARHDAGLGGGYFVLDLPATPERLRLLCGDKLVQDLGVAPDVRPKISC